MTPTARTNDSPPAPPDGPAAEGRARHLFDALRARYEHSWVRDMVVQLRAVDFLNWTTMFGAELLWSALPFIILLSSLADERIDDDLSRHIGLDNHAAHIVRSLFRNSPSHAVVPLVTGLLFAFTGIMAVVASLQVVYERVFDQEHRGWRDFPRYIAWVAVGVGVLVADGILQPESRAVGPVVHALLTVVATTIFFAWTMRFLMAGRVAWGRLIRPALVTALLWLALDIFSSIYFSGVIKDDSKTYGTIGVVFGFLTWFILIGSVVLLGAAGGVVWPERAKRRA